MNTLEVLTQDIIQMDERVRWCDDNLISYFGSTPKAVIENGKLVIYGDIVISDDIEELPYKINIVHGSVYLNNALEKRVGNFKSLKNMPDVIEGAFMISLNPGITSLVGGPSIVNGSYWANGLNLTNLDGIATYIGGSFLGFCNTITNIDAILESKICDSIYLENNPIEYEKDYDKIKLKNAYY